MLDRYKNGKTTWVDLSSPTQEEARKIMEEFRIPPELFSDITTPVPRSNVVRSGKVLKLTVDYPIVKRTDIETLQEVKFFITKNALITARYEDIVPFHKFSKEFEVLSILGKTGTLHGGHIFAGLMQTLYGALAAKIDYLETQVETIERAIFDGQERQMVSDISKLNRKIITFTQALVAQGDVMHDGRFLLLELFGNPFEEYLKELDEYFDHLMRRLSSLRDSAQELRETNQILLSTKQNEIIKTLTITTFIAFPLTLISGVFSMNATNTPFVGGRYDFWIVIGIMSITALSFFCFFKFKRWF